MTWRFLVNTQWDVREDPKVMLGPQDHFVWFPPNAGRRVHVTREETEAES